MNHHNEQSATTIQYPAIRISKPKNPTKMSCVACPQPPRKKKKKPNRHLPDIPHNPPTQPALPQLLVCTESDKFPLRCPALPLGCLFLTQCTGRKRKRKGVVVHGCRLPKHGGWYPPDFDLPGGASKLFAPGVIYPHRR